MPFKLNLPKQLSQAGWKVTIHDAEGPEKPHATIYKKLRKWRVSLRDKGFLDDHDKWSQIDKKLKNKIMSEWETLQKEWDKIHGKINPISSENDDKDNQK